MNRQNAVSILALSILLGGAAQATSHVAPVTAQQGTTAARAYDEVTLKGEIRTLDLDKRTFSLVEGEKVHAIEFGADTKFMLDGKPSTAKDALANGRRAKVVKDGDVIKSVAVLTE